MGDEGVPEEAQGVQDMSVKGVEQPSIPKQKDNKGPQGASSDQRNWQEVVQRRSGKDPDVERDVEMDSLCDDAVDVLQVMSRVEWDRVVITSLNPPNDQFSLWCLEHQRVEYPG